MRQREKRFISLVLSGVMLLSNLPLSALAEEVVEETVIITGQAPAVSRSVDAEQLEVHTTVTYPVKVDGAWLTSDMEGDDISYDPESCVLTLCDARLKSLVLEDTMTLVLEGSNIIEAEQEKALLAEKALTIAGDGSLTVTGNHAVAMQIEDGTQGETPVALTALEEITLGKEIHVKLGQTTVGKTFVFGSGYLKIGTGAFSEAGESWVSDGSGLEFVGADHVQWARTDTGHSKTCIDPDCPLATGMELEAGEHNTLTTANCQYPATCEVCGAYGSKDAAVHTEPAAYGSNEKGHWQFYPCCNAEVENSRQDHQMAYSADGNRIDHRCELCRYGNSITLQPVPGTNYVYDGTAKELVADNDIDDEELTVGYRDPAGKPLEGPPVNAGNYVAWVRYQELEAKIFFTIEPQTLTEDMVSLSPDSADYGQQAERPQIQVQEGITREILYSRGDKQTDNPEEIDWVNAGTVTISVTGTGNYTGTVTKTYTIRQAAATAEMFQFTAPENLTYNGEKKEASVTAPEGMGSFEVCYDADPVCVGTYQVSVQVAGDGNYKQATLTDNSWCFTIAPTNQYTDNTKTEQVIGEGIGDFQTPGFTGVGGEEVKGTCAYMLNEESVNENTLLARLKELGNGASATIGYTFTPDSNGNYTGTKSGTIHLTRADLTFAMDSGEAVTADAIRTETVTYGTNPLIDVSELKATLGDAVDEEDSHFTVEFTKDDSVVTTAGALDVGTYGFTVYYSNPDLGGYAIEKTEVVNGRIHITPKTLTITGDNAPKDGYIIQNQDGSPQPLLTKDNAGQTDNGLKLEYSLSQYGTYSAEIPESSEVGAYTIWYRAPQSENYDTVNANGSVTVVIFPRLTATYGDMLRDVKLPEGFTLNDQNPGTDNVGNAGDHTVKLDYGLKSLTGVPVPLTVAPKEITVSFTILNQYIKYDGENTAQPEVVVTRTDGEQDVVLPRKEYKLQYENDNGRGVAKVWPVSTGNYTFNAEPQSYYIYDPVAATLMDNAKIPGDVKDVGYPNGKAIREKLDSRFSKEYPASRRKFTYFLMKTGTGTYDYTENGWPEGGIAMKINYPTGTDGKDNFKVYAMYLVDYKDIKAGTIVEMKQAKDTLGLGEYTCYDEQICLKMPTYMAVAIGAEAEKYTLKRNSSTRGTITFTVGDDTTALTSAKVRAGETVTVHVTDIQAKYGVSMVEYYETDLGYKSSDPIKASRNDDGTYSFEMPEYNTTIKVTIRKSSGNPRTGDVIRFWVALMVISGAGVAGLLWWRKKRK